MENKLSNFNILNRVKLRDDELKLANYIKECLNQKTIENAIIESLSVMYTVFEVNKDAEYILVEKDGVYKKIPLK
jgi:hypothetical protein